MGRERELKILVKAKGKPKEQTNSTKLTPAATAATPNKIKGKDIEEFEILSIFPNRVFSNRVKILSLFWFILHNLQIMP